MKKAALQTVCRLNVSNLRETCRSTESAPPSAKADQETVALHWKRLLID